MTKLRLASSLTEKKKRLFEVDIDHNGEKQEGNGGRIMNEDKFYLLFEREI